MTGDAGLTQMHVDRVRAAAALLLPGSVESPAPAALLDFDQLVHTAAVAIGGEDSAVARAIEALPPEPTWERLSAFADADPSSFDQVALLVVGAYFMSPSVLASLQLPTGERRRAHPEQVVDELGTGILDAVLERVSPVRTLQEVNSTSDAECKAT